MNTSEKLPGSINEPPTINEPQTINDGNRISLILGIILIITCFGLIRWNSKNKVNQSDVVLQGLLQSYTQDTGSVLISDISIKTGDVLSGELNSHIFITDENCNIIQSGDYKTLDLNQNIRTTPTSEQIGNNDFRTASTTINVLEKVDDAWICLVADLDPIDKKLSVNRKNSVYFIINRPEYGGHIFAKQDKNNPSVLGGTGIFLSQEVPIKREFSLTDLPVANNSFDNGGVRISNPIEQLNKGGRQKIIAFVSKYQWGRINTIKLIYKGGNVERIGGY